MSGSLYVIDTNIVIPFLNGDSKIVARFKNLKEVQIPYVVVGELLFGALKSYNSEKNISLINSFVGTHCRVLYPSYETLRRYGQIKKALVEKGKPIPENDIWISAVAFENGFTLVSRDKHFKEVEGLTIEVW